MTGNREVITGSDFKRMVTGAYSEFLLEYENINDLSRQKSKGQDSLPGTHILRTMGAAVMPLADTKDESIGGLARRVANASMLGARGNAGVVLAQLFRGIAKGLSGKYDATSSEFGKAFQYGILYAQRVIPEEPERPIITSAKAVAKGAYHAVRANLPISEILTVAIDAGEKSLQNAGSDAGAKIMLVFLHGCLKGLDGNFVSPTVSLSLGLGGDRLSMPDPRQDMVRPYCLNFTVENAKADPAEVEKQLKENGNFVVVERRSQSLHIHLHTDHPGAVVEQAVGWGRLRAVDIINMAEPHALSAAHSALVPVAVLAIAADKAQGQRLQDEGAMVILDGSAKSCPSIGELIHAAHSDIAESYVILANSESLQLVLQQTKRILGKRVELVLAKDEAEQKAAIRAFNAKLSAKENAEQMQKLLQ